MDQNLIEKIDEIVKQNKKFTRDMNEKLNHIRGGLTKKTEDVEEAYDRGLRDMWEVVYAINAETDKGGLTMDECRAIFGYIYRSDIVEHLNYRECFNLYRIHSEKKAEEEAQTFKRGDVVQYYAGNGVKEAIFLGEEDKHYWTISDDHTVPQKLYKGIFTLTKIGRHVDLDVV